MVHSPSSWVFLMDFRRLSTEPCVKVFMVIHVGSGTTVTFGGGTTMATMEPILTSLWTLWRIFWVAEIPLRDLPDNSCLGVFVFNPLSFSFESLGVFGQEGSKVWSKSD